MQLIIMDMHGLTAINLKLCMQLSSGHLQWTPTVIMFQS